jgi:hypothetical protein
MRCRTLTRSLLLALFLLCFGLPAMAGPYVEVGGGFNEDGVGHINIGAGTTIPLGYTGLLVGVTVPIRFFGDDPPDNAQPGPCPSGCYSLGKYRNDPQWGATGKLGMRLLPEPELHVYGIGGALRTEETEYFRNPSTGIVYEAEEEVEWDPLYGAGASLSIPGSGSMVMVEWDSGRGWSVNFGMRFD